jgi:hypothetical protein
MFSQVLQMAPMAAAAFAASDRRVKTDIMRIGELANGAGHYAFRYVWDAPGTVRVGPMAQELLEVQPEAVSEVGGMLMVDLAQVEV